MTKRLDDIKVDVAVWAWDGIGLGKEKGGIP